MRGRKPKPTALIKLQGTGNSTRLRRKRAGEPIATGSLDKPPDWMTPSQVEGWAYAMEHAPKGVLFPIDRGMLAVWVEAEDRHRLASVMQAKVDVGNALPLLFKVEKGPPIASAYITIITKAATIMIKAAAKTSEWSKLKIITGGKGAA
jgi:hypothetical protein